MKMTAKQVAEAYRALAVKLAVIIGQLEDIREHCKYLKEEAEDNGDPYYDIMPVLEHAGGALASMVVYADKYSKDLSVSPDVEAE